MKINRFRASRTSARFFVIALLMSINLPHAMGADVASLQNQLNKLAADYGRIESQIAVTEAKSIQLERDLQGADLVIVQKSQRMRERAGYLYKNAGLGTYVEGLLLASDMSVFLKRIQLLAIVGDKDSQLVEGLRITRARADTIRQNIAVTRSRQLALQTQLRNKRRELEAQLKGAKSAAKVIRFGNFESFVLPVSPSAFANTWGAPRSGGRRHKGTDVMAPCGAVVVAVTRGVVSRLDSGGNGGTSLYLRASNGDEFYYAHLRGYAAGIRSGSSVNTGTLVGYNGNSGNARGGPCHVHFEWHPGGGSPVNSYPMLAAVR